MPADTAPDRAVRARPDPLRIAALSVAFAAHAALALLLFLPAAPLRRVLLDEAPVVQVIRLPAPPPPAPPAPPSPLEKAPTPPPAVEPAPTAAASDGTGGRATADTTEAPLWQFDPEAGISVVVYSDRTAVEVPAADQAPQEIAGYRAGFDPASTPGLAGAAGGSATFDVLVDESGAATALVIVQQACPERALETAMSVVSQWRYVPARRAGTPVAGWLRVALQF
ncbi:energy transducer TonB [Lysobacter xanthus]